MPESNYMNLEATELRLGLPGSNNNQPEVRYDSSTTKNNSNKRALPEDDSVSSTNLSAISDATNDNTPAPPMPKSQIVGWPPVRSYRKNNLQTVLKKPSSEGSEDVVLYVKVSMDGAPYLRKIDLKLYICYSDLLEVLEDMFKVKIGQYSEREGYNGSDYTPTYEDKDGDWMLVGDVPWTMFVLTCKRLRIMKSSEAKGLGQTSH